MTKPIVVTTAFLSMLFLSGCVQVPDDIASKKIVRYDRTHAPRPLQEEILFIPAGSKLAIDVRLSGDAFAKHRHERIYFAMKQDTYLYPQKHPSGGVTPWLSHDKKHWRTLQERYEGAIRMEIRTDTTHPGIEIVIDANEQR